jgi:spore germination protein GerM
MVRAARALALVAVAVAASACGVVAGGGAHAIPPDQVPFHLLTKRPPSTTTTTAPAAVPVTVYFVSRAGQTLTTAPRTVPVQNTLRTVVHALLAGPTTVEKSYGVRTAISQDVQLLRAKPERPTGTTGVVTLDFNQAFGAISGTQQVVAVAQIVYTVTAYLGVGYGVEFQIDGVPTDVPTATGAQVTGAVRRTTYASLVATG